MRIENSYSHIRLPAIRLRRSRWQAGVIDIIRIIRMLFIMDTLKELFTIIKQRQKTLPQNSYTAELFRKGTDKITKKLGEEAIEVIIAAKNKNKQEITYEMADLWYHCLVLLAHSNLTPEDIAKELKKRFK